MTEKPKIEIIAPALREGGKLLVEYMGREYVFTVESVEPRFVAGARVPSGMYITGTSEACAEETTPESHFWRAHDAAVGNVPPPS